MRTNWFLLSLWWIGPSMALGGLWVWYQNMAQRVSLVHTGEVIVLGGLTVGCVFLGVTYTAFVRRVEVSATGVVFVRGLSRRRVAWSDLHPPKYPYALGLQFGAPGGPGLPQGLWFAVSRPAARAILAHPKCPRMDLSPEILNSIGLPAEWRQPAA